MEFTRIFVGFLLVAVSLADTGADNSDHQQRSTRTLGTLFGGGTQAQQQQVDKPVAPTASHDRPLVYHVKYYTHDTRQDSKSSPIDKLGPEQVGPRVFFYTSSGENRGEQPQVAVSQQQNPGYVGYYYNPVVGLAGQQQAVPVRPQSADVKEQQVLVPCPVDYVYVPATSVVSEVKKQPVVDKVPVVPVVDKVPVVQPVVQPVVRPIVYTNPSAGVAQQNKPHQHQQGVVVYPYAYPSYGQYQYSQYPYVTSVSPYSSGSVGVGVGNSSPYVGYYDEQQHRYVYVSQSPYVYPYMYKPGVGSDISNYPYNAYGVYQVPVQVLPVKAKDAIQQQKHKQQVSEPKNSNGDHENN